MHKPTMLIVFAMFAASFCLALAGVWPILVSRLTALNWATMILMHLAALGSLASIYINISKRKLIQQAEVLMAAGFVLMTWGADLSMIGRILER